MTLGGATARTVAELTGTAKGAGPDLTDIAKATVQGTVHDFTHLDPMHPLFPALDVLSLASLGAGSVARGGAALSRIGEEGSALAKVGEALTKTVPAGRARDIQLVHPEIDYTTPGLEAPAVPLPSYSQAPLRAFLEKNVVDTTLGSKIGSIPVPSAIPGVAEDTALRDLRSAFNLRKIVNVTRGRASAQAVSGVVNATQGFNRAMDALLKEEGGRTDIAAMKFNAAVLSRKLAADNLTPAERLELLSTYRERMPIDPENFQEGIVRGADADKIRALERDLTSSKEYREYFSEPTPAMQNLMDELTNSTIEGLKALNIDPNEVLNTSLGPIAYLQGKTPEEALREQPALVQNQTNFTIKANDVEQALLKSGGSPVAEEATPMAQFLPSSIPLADRQKLVQDAIDSLKEDIAARYTRRDLNNNATSTGYLQGNTIAQKVAAGLHDRFGIDPEISSRYAIGGLHNYFPSASALRMKIRPGGTRISRAMDRLTGREPAKPYLSEYKHGNPVKLLRTQELGVAPFSGFMHQNDLTLFKSGIERRDPATFVRHMQQVQRRLAHELIAEPVQRQMAIKDAATGAIKGYSNEDELIQDIGVDGARRYMLVPIQAMGVLFQAQGQAAVDVAKVLTRSEGHISPEVDAEITNIVDESAHETVRQLSNTAIATQGKLAAWPRPYAEQVIKHAQLLDNPKVAGKFFRAFTDHWRTAVLALTPGWVLRTVMGHGLVLVMGGVWNPAHYIHAMRYFGDGFKVPGTDLKIAQGLDRPTVPGIDQGSPHTDFNDLDTHNVVTSKIIGATTGTVHRIANFQRRAAFIALLNKAVKARFDELDSAMKIPAILRSKDLDYVIANHPELVHDALNELDRISYTFGQMSPWERRLAKHVMPFYGWYKFINKFAYSLPVTYPGRSLAMARIGQIGSSEQDQLGMIPGWLRSSLMFDTHNLAQLHYISMLGLNPLGDVANPSGGIEGIARLGQLNPLIQATLEAMGTNPLTGGPESIDPTSGIIEVNGQYYNALTGQPAGENLGTSNLGADIERFFGGLAREFPQIRLGETWYTQGRPLYPESLPFISEKVIPQAAGVPLKPFSPVALGLQYLGVGPKTYNLSHWQQTQQANILRARSTYLNAIAKQKAQGLIK
jgi:hypothetical protein